MSMTPETAPPRAEVQFNCKGHASGKMRNELSIQMVKPFLEPAIQMSTDEGDFHGGDASAPPPLAYFVAGLTGCIMTQIRAFAKRMDVTLDDLSVETRVVWDWQKAGRVYETAPKSFDIDVMIDSPDADAKVIALINAAKKGCFIEQTLAQRNNISHYLVRNGTPVPV